MQVGVVVGVCEHSSQKVKAKSQEFKESRDPSVLTITARGLLFLSVVSSSTFQKFLI